MSESHLVVYNSLLSPWAVARQISQSMGIPRQEYWSGLPFPSPGGHLNPRIKPRSPTLQADSLPPEPPGKQKLSEFPRNEWISTIKKERERAFSPDSPTARGNIRQQEKKQEINILII